MSTAVQPAPVQAAAHEEHLAAIERDPAHFLTMTTDALFDLDWPAVEALQLRLLQRRFAELRPKVKVLDRLAGEVGVDRIDSFDDLVPLGLPHTMYKSYAAGDIENGRWDKLTRWLGTLSAYDLSGVDLEGVETIEEWLCRVAAATPMRPVSSSGTSGKISVLPRGVPEDVAHINMTPRTFETYRGEHGVDIRGGDIPYLCPWPSEGGRQAFANVLQMMRDSFYEGKEVNVRTVGKGYVTADELRLTSRLLRAESLGETLTLTEDETRIAQGVAERNSHRAQWMDEFIETSVIGLRGKTVLFYSMWTQIYQICKLCKDRGIRIEWAPDSLVVSGGGAKGFAFPDGWRDVLTEMPALSTARDIRDERVHGDRRRLHQRSFPHGAVGRDAAGRPTDRRAAAARGTTERAAADP